MSVAFLISSSLSRDVVPVAVIWVVTVTTAIHHAGKRPLIFVGGRRAPDSSELMYLDP